MNSPDNILVFSIKDGNILIDSKKSANVKNFIADLNGVDLDTINKIKDKFITFDRNVSNKKGSFVIVCQFSFNDKLTIVPTLQEAYDYIEMEEIERQLNI
tara:strand:+ start:3032 stop:3331 length:300 start_codon:yes stop_codon:yes gene_type:complete